MLCTPQTNISAGPTHLGKKKSHRNVDASELHAEENDVSKLHAMCLKNYDLL